MEIRLYLEILLEFVLAIYYKDDEVVVVASERPVIQTVFNVPFDEVKELEPGHALLIKKMDICLFENIRTIREKIMFI